MLPPPADRPAVALPPQLQRTRLRELPLISSSDWNDVDMVRSAMVQLENGTFDRAAQVVDAMGRDDRISGVLSTRSGALPSLEMTLEPGKGARAEEAAEAAEANWNRMFPADQLASLVDWGIMLGAGIARLNWTLGDMWLPTIQVWHPRPLMYRWQEEAYFINAQDSTQLEVTPGANGWVLFAPYGLKRGWLKGRVRSLYVPWLIRQFGMRDWARYSEVHGMPIRQVIVPSSASDSEVDTYMEEIANLGQENIIRAKRVADAGDDPERDYFEVKLVEALGRSTETFQGIIELANTCIAVNLLGQNLSTEVKGGSFAAAVAHTAIRNDILQADAELLGQCLVEQVLREWATWNYGDPDAAPKPCWRTKPDEDKVAKNQALLYLGQGIAALQGTGAQIDVDALLKEEGIDVTAPAEDPPPKAAPVAVAPLPGKPKQLAASLETEDLPPALIAGQMYADKLAGEGAASASKVLAPNLGQLLDIIEKAESWETIRLSLESTYKSWDADRLARLLAETLVLAQLAGRHTVLEENVEDAGK